MGGALDRDIDRMWETRPFRNGMVVSTPAAMNAARRVFKDARALRGMTMEQARTWLKTDRRNAAFKLGKPRYDLKRMKPCWCFRTGGTPFAWWRSSMTPGRLPIPGRKNT